MQMCETKGGSEGSIGEGTASVSMRCRPSSLPKRKIQMSPRAERTRVPVPMSLSETLTGPSYVTTRRECPHSGCEIPDT
ncbi:Hypothetical protein NTJ_00005 [Nesidiocoris tenuis]|uniref:Uncharacterized protein n=1 Tax=Nesidiocoris tenuis TaxID=355587 RepID=A0ABN7A598_9HEMI|nr:Hypothetical protein NTJ_00005 [Nesidiocoris tenuis]